MSAYGTTALFELAAAALADTFDTVLAEPPRTAPASRAGRASGGAL